MKIHPLILLLLVACALGGAYAIGRLSQVASQPPPPPAAPPPALVVQPTAPVQLVPTSSQKAEIETPQGKFTVEAGVTVK